MMKKILTIIAISTLGLASQSAFAGGFNIGAKSGFYKVDPNNGSELDVKSVVPMVSAQIGYEFLDLTAVALAAELELGKTLSKVKFEDNEGDSFKASATVMSGYLSARTIGPVYAIGRVGYSQTKLSLPEGSVKFKKPAIGAGVGFSLGVRSEIELTQYTLKNDDGNFGKAYYLTFGGSF